MCYVYVLRSIKNNKKYIGFTERSVQKRLQEHNSGSNKFTRENSPFKVVYSEEHEDKDFARKREKFLKSGHGREFFKKLFDKT